MQKICNDPKMVQTLRLLCQIWSSDIREQISTFVSCTFTQLFRLDVHNFCNLAFGELGCSFRQGLIHYIKYMQNVYMHSNRD